MIVKTAGREDVLEKARMLIVGQSDNAKRDFAATAPDALWVTATPDRRTLGRLNARYVDIHSLQDLLDVKVALDRSAEDIEELFGYPVKTVIFDSLEELQRVFLEEHLANEGRKETKIEDWGWVSKKFNNIFAGFSKLDVDLIVLSGVKDVPISESEVWVKPAIQGSFADQVHRYMNYSLYLHSNTFEEAVEAPVTDAETVDGEVDLTTEKIVTTQSAWLLCKPISYAQWINDSSETLPFKYELEFDRDFEKIIFHLSLLGKMLESSEQEIDPHQEEPETADENEPTDSDVSSDDSNAEPEDQTDNPVCEVCGAAVESNWLLLSEMKGWPPLCKKHFTARNN